LKSYLHFSFVCYFVYWFSFGSIDFLLEILGSCDLSMISMPIALICEFSTLGHQNSTNFKVKTIALHIHRRGNESVLRPTTTQLDLNHYRWSKFKKHILSIVAQCRDASFEHFTVLHVETASFSFFLFFFVFQKQIDQLGHSNNVERTYYCNLDCRRYVKIESCIESQKFPTRIHPQKNDFFFFFFFFVLCALSCPSTASAHGNGAGQCTVPADITATGAISGMASRGRDGTNTVTVTPASAAPGAKVQIKVAATEFIGVLGAVYAGTAKVGTHTATATTKTCQSNADAITHSDVLAAGTTSLTWDYTLPATATGSLEVRVVTLNGAEGASDQKFALGKATITVAAGTAGTSTPAAGGSTNAAGTTAAGTTGGATTKAPASTSAASLLTVGSAVVAAVAALLL
jgi:hypothetical protein